MAPDMYWLENGIISFSVSTETCQGPNFVHRASAVVLTLIIAENTVAV